MKISIITVTYNSRDTIKDTIESVRSQTYDDIEYIIIDGGSTDGTIEIVKEYENYVDVFISEPDEGIYDAMNKGIALASGDVIGFLHSDDEYYTSSVIEKIAQEFKKGSLDGIYADLIYVNSKNRVIRYWRSTEFKPNMLKKGWMPPHPTLFLKKQIYEKYGMFDVRYKIAADYDFILRIFKQNLHIYYLPTIIYKMRLGGVSNKSIGNILKKTAEDYQIIKKNGIGGLGTLMYKNFSKIGQFSLGKKPL